MIYKNMTHKQKAEILPVQTIEEFSSLISQLDMLVATRMHPSIIAALNNVPFVLIRYEHKQAGLLLKLGLEDVDLSITEISYDGLKKQTQKVWNNREKIREHLSQEVPKMREHMKTRLNTIISGVVGIYASFD